MKNKVNISNYITKLEFGLLIVQDIILTLIIFSIPLILPDPLDYILLTLMYGLSFAVYGYVVSILHNKIATLPVIGYYKLVLEPECNEGKRIKSSDIPNLILKLSSKNNMFAITGINTAINSKVMAGKTYKTTSKDLCSGSFIFDTTDLRDYSTFKALNGILVLHWDIESEYDIVEQFNGTYTSPENSVAFKAKLERVTRKYVKGLIRN
ncbi:hypothetical protein [Clostridium tertium]|uniref:hypothetical protein n=1 Tax=Clostridium tertium TaxID=1559 RepID=UPI0023B297C4|nr:hypothetical protein [Clostridium tertium]